MRGPRWGQTNPGRFIHPRERTCRQPSVLDSSRGWALFRRSDQCADRDTSGTPFSALMINSLILRSVLRRTTRNASRFKALRATTTPLVGRGEEIDLLLRRWEQAKGGEGSAVLLSGEPGIGKSRIAETILERLSDEPHTRLRLFCSPHHQDTALYPSITQLERAAGFRRDDR